MFDLTQHISSDTDPVNFVKAVRLATVASAGILATAQDPARFLEHQRDVLAALRSKGVLFLCLIARLPGHPLLFAYGVQGIADTPAQAQALADASYDELTTQLAGQLEARLAPLTKDQTDALSSAQDSWDQIAMLRGRALPTSGATTPDQLGSFLEHTTSEFLLTFVTFPVSPTEMTLAWRQIAQELSLTRVDQDKARTLFAGVSIPLTLIPPTGSQPLPVVSTRPNFTAAMTLKGDLLEAQMRRYLKGIEEGAFCYQGFLTAPDAASLDNASEQLRHVFAEGIGATAIPCPFHIVEGFSPDEVTRLTDHARAFTSDRRPDTTNAVEPFVFSSYVTLSELAVFTHPRVL
jgi:hypothetical protein